MEHSRIREEEHTLYPIFNSISQSAQNAIRPHGQEQSALYPLASPPVQNRDEGDCESWHLQLISHDAGTNGFIRPNCGK